ncbi:pyridoxal kinase [Anthonomus grandis grandis]|uniref:pyridoxal kinase n=1 Tax=Anthonomus grandis grandis TaxID=2921223 RepID=UPI0021660770|nr:pyridoxal kinase [Anthonomus grandis grandis]XP_050309285.1 pyridoxal kinase [Anthonomus grandis grandis]
MEPRVLSIQSHVVSGYVGNKSAVFPMQILGFDVDFVNSVQFSNHTGYSSVKGHVITENELEELFIGLKENGIARYTHLLTGYVGSPGFLKQIANILQHLKHENPNIIYVCDPVMGDNGEMYVPQELLPIYKDIILPLATVLVPNLYETEQLTDIKIDTEEKVWEAIEVLHKKGIQVVCVTSLELPVCKGKICIFASSKKKGHESDLRLKMTIPKINETFTGSGDLFAALLLCFLYKSGSNLKDSLEKTVAALQAVLTRTFNFTSGKPSLPQYKELRLIQSKDDIMNPKVVYKATVVEKKK